MAMTLEWKVCEKMKAIPILLITFSLLPPHSLLAGELPDLASVVSGLVEVTKSPDVMTIRQATERTSINWTSFPIANGKTVNFIQPSSSSVALNTVLGSQPSNIFGSLNANGHVFLINPNGILFSPTAQVSKSE
jgi:filamentous hemagglutinin family protein